MISPDMYRLLRVCKQAIDKIKSDLDIITIEMTRKLDSYDLKEMDAEESKEHRLL
jgi:hypothetical protein